jgi:hypothetical protein
MSQELTHISAGDKIAINNNSRLHSHVPQITYHVLSVDRVTATQIVCIDRGTEIRFRRKDGCQVGEYFRHAIPATKEILETHSKEVAELHRWRTAAAALDSLIDKPLHKLGLSTDQLEKLAAAWADIQKTKESK